MENSVITAIYKSPDADIYNIVFEGKHYIGKIKSVVKTLSKVELDIYKGEVRNYLDPLPTGGYYDEIGRMKQDFSHEFYEQIIGMQMWADADIQPADFAKSRTKGNR